MTLEFRQFHLRDRIAEQSISWLNLIAGGLIGGSFLLWSVPPFFLAKNKLSHFWVQGLVLFGAVTGSSVGLAIGYKLRRMEALLNAEQQQEDEDFLHWLASNRYYIESLRENAVEAALAQQRQAALAARAPEPTSESCMPVHAASVPPVPVTHPAIHYPSIQSVPQAPVPPTPQLTKEPIDPRHYIPHPETPHSASHAEIPASNPPLPAALSPEVPSTKTPRRHLKLVKSVVHEPPHDLEAEMPASAESVLENFSDHREPESIEPESIEPEPIEPEPIDRGSRVGVISDLSTPSPPLSSPSIPGPAIVNPSNPDQSLGSVTRIDIKTSRRPALMPVSSSIPNTDRSFSNTRPSSNSAMNTNSNETIPLGYRLSGPPEPQAPMMPGKMTPAFKSCGNS